MTSRPSRFHAVGGSLMADVCHELPLEDAQRQLMKFWNAAHEAQRMGNRRLAEEIRRQADDLQAAKLAVEQWRRSAGWERPEDVDAQRVLFAASLQHSVEG